MSNKKEPRPMAICESCYLEDHTRWEPESMDENGTILMKLVGVDVPDKVNTESVETCCLCGALTIAGIFEVKKLNCLFWYCAISVFSASITSE